MKKKILAGATASVMASIMLAGTAMAAEYKVGIIQFVDSNRSPAGREIRGRRRQIYL